MEVKILPPDEGMVLKYFLTCNLKKKGLALFGVHFAPDGQILLNRWQA